MSGPKPKGRITKVPSGWRVRVEIGGKEFSRTFKVEDDAEAYLSTLLEESTVDERRTLATLGKHWLDARELSGIYRHVDKERSVWKAHIAKWECHEWQVNKIARKHIAALVRSMCDKKTVRGERLSRAVVKHVLRLVKRCLDFACDEGWIDTNPAVGVEVPRRAGGPRKWTYLELDEIERVFALEQPVRKDWPFLDLERRAAYAIAIYGGLRKSEIWQLRWEDIDLDGPRPTLHVRTGKSDSAVRDVPVLPQASEHLRRWRDRGGVTRRFGLVFPPTTNNRASRSRHGDDYDAGWRDHPWRDRGVRKVRLGTASRCGFGRKVRFHDLRHTCASHLVMGSWTPDPLNIQQARRWLGHSSTSVTDRYAHMGSEGLHAALESEENRSRVNAGKGPLTTEKDR